MLKKMPGLDKSKEDSRSITTIQVKSKCEPQLKYYKNVNCNRKTTTMQSREEGGRRKLPTATEPRYFVQW